MASGQYITGEPGCCRRSGHIHRRGRVRYTKLMLILNVNIIFPDNIKSLRFTLYWLLYKSDILYNICIKTVGKLTDVNLQQHNTGMSDFISYGLQVYNLI